MMNKRAVVLISGGGSLLDCIVDMPKVDVVAVMSSTSEGGLNQPGLRRAWALCERSVRLGYFSKHMDPQGRFFISDNRECDWARQGQMDHLASWILESNPDIIIMAGFKYRWRFPHILHHRVLNIHPAVDQHYFGQGWHGLKVHKAVLKAGLKTTGCTIHYADHEYDHGDIISQHYCDVTRYDTPSSLAKRVLKLEQRAYPMVINVVLRTIYGSTEYED